MPTPVVRDHSDPHSHERLRQQWRALALRVGLAAEGADAWNKLVIHYREPGRHYHNFAHVADCLRVFAAHADLAPEPSAIEAAIWFHDVIYDVGASDNELRSATLAQRTLCGAGAGVAWAARVAELIRTTDYRRSAEDAAARLLCDIDLSILGREPAEYDRYARAIQREVGWPATQFAAARSAFLRSFLARTWIFQTDRMRGLYESAARANLRRELESWQIVISRA